MKNITLANAAKACGGTLYSPGGLTDEQAAREASCVVIDSRKMEKNGIFIATKGEKVDGHSFIPNVAQMGALGVICEQEPEDCRIPYILVEDSFKALKDLAEFYRMQLDLPVVGITGSVGKTSTKEFIAAVLSRKYHVLKTQGNYNNEIGLPLTVLSIRKEHQAAVLEMGISDFGEMHRLSKIARPDICVITNIGQCHLENLGSREGILKAKSEIFDFMNPDGYVLVNGDDDLLTGIEKRGSHEPIRFGLNSENEIFASDVEGRGLLGTTAVVHAKNDMELFEVTGMSDGAEKKFPIEILLPGEHMVRNALAAAGVGFLMGLTAPEVKEGILAVEAVSGRSHLVRMAGCLVIDDCYNANPVSMRAAIDLLATAPERKVAILGDMFELGEREKELHGEIGTYAVDTGMDVLLCVGNLSAYMYEQGKRRKEEKQKDIELFYFSTRDEMLDRLPEILKRGDNILVKASHGMQFEKVVEAIAKSSMLGYTD